MKEEYNKISELVKTDRLDKGTTISEHLSKLFEESGELAKEVNRLTGRKSKGNRTEIEIIDNLTSEAADTIQCVFAVCTYMGVEYDDIIKHLIKNNNKFKQIVDNGGHK